MVATAARDPGVDAIVAQVPFSDGLATATNLVRRGSLSYAAGAIANAARDLSRAALGRDPHYVPIVGEPDEFAAMNTPDAKPGYESLRPDGERLKQFSVSHFRRTRDPGSGCAGKSLQ